MPTVLGQVEISRFWQYCVFWHFLPILADFGRIFSGTHRNRISRKHSDQGIQIEAKEHSFHLPAVLSMDFERVASYSNNCWPKKTKSLHIIIMAAYIHPEVNISSYPGTLVPGLFFFCRAEILNSGGFVQKYSDQGVSCKNIGQWQPPGTVMCYPWVQCLLRENQMVH